MSRADLTWATVYGTLFYTVTATPTTPKHIFEQRLAAHLKAKPEVVQKAKAVYQFDLTGDNGGTWTIDLTRAANYIVPGKVPNPGVTVTMSAKDFIELVEGRLNAAIALMQRRIKLTGDITLAMKIPQLLG